jgi:hypothetical protein
LEKGWAAKHGGGVWGTPLARSATTICDITICDTVYEIVNKRQ